MFMAGLSDVARRVFNWLEQSYSSAMRVMILLRRVLSFFSVVACLSSNKGLCATRMGFYSGLYMNISLIGTYCECYPARNLLDERLKSNEASWISVISGFDQWGDVEKPRDLFEQIYVRKNFVVRLF